MAQFENPFLRGYYGAQFANNADAANNINTINGLMALQSNMEMKPLQAALLRSQVDSALLANAFKRGIFGGAQQSPSAPPAFGDGGVSLPGGGQANLNTGQVLPPNVPQIGSMFRSPEHAQQAMLIGDPGITAAAKSYLEQMKPINVRPGGTVYIPGQGPQYTAPGTNGTQINYGPNGPQIGIIPGAIPSQTALGNTPLQEVKNPDGTTSFIPKAQLSASAGQPTFGNPSHPSNPMRVPPDVQRQRDGDRLQILYGERSQQQASGRVDPALEREIAAEEKKQGAKGGAATGIPRFGQTQEQQLQQGAQSAANTEASKEFISEMRQNYAKLRDVPATLANMDRARQLALTDAKSFMGPFGESKLAITKFLRSNVPGMGNLDTSGVTNAEQLQSTLFNQVMDNLKKMDASPSQYQQQVMQEAFGTLRTDPQSVPKILDVFADILRNRVAIHNQTVTSAEGRGTLFPYDVKIPLASPTDKAISDANGAPQRRSTDAMNDPLGLRKR